MIALDGPALRVEARPNGRAAIPFSIVDRATGQAILTDAQDIVKAETRQRVIEACPTAWPVDLRAEAAELLSKVAAEIVRAQVSPAKADDEQGQAITFADPEPWEEPVDGAQLLGRIHALVTRFLGLPPGGDLLLAVFALYTHAADAFDTAPYIVLHSPAPQCGKTRALEILGLLTRRAWQTICPSTAVLFRVLEQHATTLLLDEAEVVRGQGDSAKDVQALLQSGYRRGACVPRCVGDDNEVRNFRVFGPKAFALIGELPPALFDRCIKIEMQRRPRGERLERFRFSRVEPEALMLRRMAARWARDYAEALRTVEVPELPFLDERQEEAWSPLLAVGVLAGGDWYERLREAAGQLSGGRTTTSPGIELLADVRAIFNARGVDRITSSDLAAALGEMEGRPWAEWSRGRPISTTALARMLKPFGVASTSDGATRGYRWEAFTTLWDVYLNPSTCQDPSNDGTKQGSATRQADRQADGSEIPESPHSNWISDRLTGQSRGIDGPGLFDEVSLPSEPEGDDPVAEDLDEGTGLAVHDETALPSDEPPPELVREWAQASSGESDSGVNVPEQTDGEDDVLPF